jgi:hypothetical protein
MRNKNRAIADSFLIVFNNVYASNADGTAAEDCAQLHHKELATIMWFPGAPQEQRNAAASLFP